MRVVGRQDEELLRGIDTIEQRQNLVLGLPVVDLLELIKDHDSRNIDALNESIELITTERLVDDDGCDTFFLSEVRQGLRQKRLARTFNAIKVYTSRQRTSFEGVQDPFSFADGVTIKLLWHDEVIDGLEIELLRHRILFHCVVLGWQLLADLDVLFRHHTISAAHTDHISHNISPCVSGSCPASLRCLPCR